MPKDIATPSTKKTRAAASTFVKKVSKAVRGKLRSDHFNVEKSSRFRVSALNARLKEAEDDLAKFSLTSDAAGANVADGKSRCTISGARVQA